MNREERRRQNKLNKSKQTIRPQALSGDALTAFELAKSHFENGDYEAADEHCQDASASAPLDAEPFHLRALIQYRLGNLGLAGDMILEAITRNDDDPEIHSNCGAIMNMLGRHMEAEAACRHVLEINPRRAEAHSNLAVALEMQGRFDEAIASCRDALNLQSNFPEARINLGNLLVRTGDLIGAVEAYAKVIEQSPDNPTAHANMSVALLRLNEAEAAESFAIEALQINPDYPEALIALGNAHAAQKHFDDAIAAFEKALSIQPNSVEAGLNRGAALHKNGSSDDAVAAYRDLIVDGKAAGEVFQGLGVVLLARGGIDEAVQAFRDAIAVKPGLGDAHYNLASALGASIEDTEFKTMQSVLADPKTPLLDQISLHFAIGEVLDKRHEFDQAFAVFKNGNELRKSLLNSNEIEFDPDEFDAHIASVIEQFPVKNPIEGSIGDMANEAPVFIVGMPRSGTTLVEQMIAAHPRAISLGEAETFMGLIGDGDANQDDTDFERDIRAIFSDNAEKQRIVDKTPFHFMCLGAIERVFPKARIIHCQRNLLDVGLSCYFQNFTNAHAWATDLSHIRRYIEGEQRMMSHWKKVSNLSTLTVDYETLITDTSEQCQAMIRFLGLDWNEQCLNFHSANSKSLTASNWQVRQPIYTTSIDRAQAYKSHIGLLGGNF